MLERTYFIQQLEHQLRIHPVVALLGPRQSGKTTLASQFIKKFAGPVFHFDLENPEDLLALSEPMRVLERLKGLVVIDEIQYMPTLFPILRVLADKKEARFLILGSASRDLVQRSAESLAGRVGYIELTPLQLAEGCALTPLLLRGGFPNAYLANSDEDSFLWREAYIQTFLERDIPALGFQVPPLMLRRFWMMLTHVHGQLLNMHGLATSLGVSGHSIRRYIDILAGTFMLRVMPPWFVNSHKRQVKSPKLFFRDSGLLLTLLGIHTEDALLHHPSLGAIWEGFAMEQVIQALHVQPEQAFFWRTAQGAELDLLCFIKGKRLGYEFKFADAPKLTKSMLIALEDLELDHLTVIYPGKREIPLHEFVTAVGLEGWVGGFAKAIP